MELYELAAERGLEHESHGSLLYLRATLEAWAIVRHAGVLDTVERVKLGEENWIAVPNAGEPFWGVHF